MAEPHVGQVQVDLNSPVCSTSVPLHLQTSPSIGDMPSRQACIDNLQQLHLPECTNPGPSVDTADRCQLQLSATLPAVLLGVQPCTPARMQH